ncbi:MAG: hypothetical protein PVG35_09245 [Desulfobacterales bacterium]|jgi:hypothetical protein
MSKNTARADRLAHWSQQGRIMPGAVFFAAAAAGPAGDPTHQGSRRLQ